MVGEVISNREASSNILTRLVRGWGLLLHLVREGRRVGYGLLIVGVEGRKLRLECLGRHVVCGVHDGLFAPLVCILQHRYIEYIIYIQYDNIV